MTYMKWLPWRFAIEVATRYANQCDWVFAPSDSIRQLLNQRGVITPISIVPTGVSLESFARGDGAALQRHALDTAETYSMPRSADKALGLYADLIARVATATQREDHHWEDMLTWIRTEWTILKSLAAAGDSAVTHVNPKDPKKGGQIAP